MGTVYLKWQRINPTLIE
ncbi:hypothetical protein L195_g050627, partial [Trifolium pratense]